LWFEGVDPAASELELQSQSHEGKGRKSFWHVKLRWKGLGIFHDGEAQQNYLVFIAVACLNYALNNEE